jgi:subtilisin
MLGVFLLATPAVAASRGGMIHVIVNFKGPGLLRPQQQTYAVREATGTVTLRFRLINAVAATIPAGQLKALKANPSVKSVEPDAPIKAFADPELDAAWGVKHIGAGDVHAAGNTGAGVKVGIIDTGIDYTHPDLDAVYAGGYDFFNNDADPFDDNGHGTHVAGILAAEMDGQGVVGVAPGASVYSYKVLGADGSGDYSGLIAALERASLVDQVQVVNMSLGGSVASDALAAEVGAAYARGVVLVAASGNVDPTNFMQLLYGCPVAYPAAYPEVFATTYTNPNDALTGYSCTGPQVDFASPGDQIYSTVPTGSCMFCAPSGYRGDMSGTSMASPHLAGTVALVLAHGIANWGDQATLADDVKAHLCATTTVGFGVNSTPIVRSDPRYAQYFGCGVVNAARALLTSPPPDPGTPEPPPPVNGAPVAVADSAVTTAGTAVTINVLANDSDPDGDPLSVASVGAPGHGTTAIVSGGVRYTPTGGYQGTDSFGYTVSDGRGGSASALVSVTVNAAPPGPSMHVSDLDAFPTRQTSSWSARVRITVQSETNSNLWLVTVKAVWDTGQTQSCTTGLFGYCDMTLVGIPLTVTSRTFTITALTGSGRTYLASANRDPDPDSNGTTILINKP